MTVEQQVDALTTAVDELKAAVVSKKATLDASVSDAQAATALATTAKTAALSARDQASASKDAAYAYAQSAGSAVAYQDLTALAASKAVTAVDVFIYDTSKDSDGGAWRHRCTGTSWYNETLNTATRGSRREFPAVAVIVAESNKVTIYDGDDPALPMWMVFNVGGTGSVAAVSMLFSVGTCISMLNGVLVSGGDANWRNGVETINFISEVVERSAAGGTDISVIGLAHRNDTNVFTATSTKAIVNGTVNDVAMTVLPDAPIDPATGLPVPTIAVATAGGVSVITDSGVIADISTFAEKVAFVGDRLWFGHDTGGLQSGPIPTETISLTDWRDYFINNASVPAIRELGVEGIADGAFIAPDSLVLLDEDPATPAKGMVAYTTSTYNTGWMNGDIKGAFLADTDDTDLVASGELITNGTFDTDTSGWTASAGTFTSVSGEGVLTSGTTTYVYQAFSTVVGATYKATGTIVSLSGGAYRAIRKSDNTVATSNTVTIRSSVGTGEIDFVATSTTTYIIVQLNGVDPADTVTVDNISVKLADADRSVNNNGLIVNGTVTRSPVATGAELVAYSGFSSSNYLEQPYNSDLDFGTGDFSIMGWVNTDSAAGVQALLDTRDNAFNSGIFLYLDAGRLYLNTKASAGGSTVTTSADLRDGNWHFVVGTRTSSGTLLAAYVDGNLANTASVTARDVSTTSSPSFVGISSNLSAGQFGGSLALLRISATAPTAEQIKKIYEDEKVLFQEGAQATLYGTSNAVTALAHDPDTDLLHVGTSQGRSVFKGLRRVSNTTTGVGTAISAVNGMVVEE